MAKQDQHQSGGHKAARRWPPTKSTRPARTREELPERHTDAAGDATKPRSAASASRSGRRARADRDQDRATSGRCDRRKADRQRGRIGPDLRVGPRTACRTKGFRPTATNAANRALSRRPREVEATSFVSRRHPPARGCGRAVSSLPRATGVRTGPGPEPPRPRPCRGGRRRGDRGLHGGGMLSRRATSG